MAQLTVHIHTIGCRANQADSSVLAAHLNPQLAVVTEQEDADVYVINTCCVTLEAERDGKKIARRLLREHPRSKVIFVGCAVSAFADFAHEFSSQVLSVGGGATSPKALARWMNDFASGVCSDAPLPSAKSRNYAYFSDDTVPFDTVGNVPGRTRALLKIQNGCTHNCSYCIVPRARGPEQSMGPDEIFRNVALFKEAGALELVFTGVQIGAWGKDLPHHPGLPFILDESAKIFSPGRIRLSSIEPWSVTEALVDVVARNDRICNHLHIPLQSGDDEVLQDMRRGYRASDWIRVVRAAQEKIPGVAIGTDVICGFPTENEVAFQHSIQVLEQARVSYVHGFSYSRRPGTAAAKKWGDNRTVAKERVRVLRALGERLHAEFRSQQEGRRCEVFVEESSRGLTDTFLPVRLKNEVPGALIQCQLRRCPDHADSLCANAE